MPQFKTTYNIIKKPDEDEAFNPAWMESNKLILPPKVDWDYSRELKIEDIDLWEVIYEESGGKGLYAAYMPYAEFYMITIGLYDRYIPGTRTNEKIIETYYGAGSQTEAVRRAQQLGWSLWVRKVWIENEDAWLYEPPKATKIMIGT